MSMSICICVHITIILLVCFHPFWDGKAHSEPFSSIFCRNRSYCHSPVTHNFKQHWHSHLPSLLEVVRAWLSSVHDVEEVLGKAEFCSGARQLTQIFFCVTFPQSGTRKQNSHNKSAFAQTWKTNLHDGKNSQNKYAVCWKINWTFVASVHFMSDIIYQKQ